MKREFLKEKLGAIENVDSIIDAIMAENGNDINKAKGDVTAKDATIAELNTKVTELTTNASKYKDYDQLLKENQAFKAEKENGKKVAFLKAQGCLHPDLFIDRIDFTKGKYNEEKKTYEGLDDAVKGLKSGYGDLFSNKSINDNPGGTGKETLTGVEASFYQLNPGLAKEN